MRFTDSERLDFLEKWETSSHSNTWFTILTQHVNKQDYPTLREFCDYSIDFEKMIDSNGLDVIAWHHIPTHIQEIVISVWENENRILTDDEKDSIQTESNSYWKEVWELEESIEDK